MNYLPSASHNSRKATLILVFLVIFSATIGFLIGKSYDAGFTGAGIATALSICYAVSIVFFSEKVILNSLSAKEIARESNTQLYHRTAELARTIELPIPALYYIDDTSMNALALGRSHAHGKIVITKGLMEKLTTSEIEAVLAHELSHIKSLDTKINQYVTLTVALFPFIAETLRRKSILFLPFSFLLSLLSPLSAVFMHVVISPKREFEADASGALLTRYPQGLAQALEKITQDPYSVRTALHATSHLFTVNPFHGKANRSASSLFTTHPPIQERIKILRSM